MIVFVLGGARSGKSAVAERQAAELASGGPVTYIATAMVGADEDLAARVATHRARRPSEWPTLEVGRGGDLPAALADTTGTVLVDGLGPWVSGLADMAPDAGELCAALAQRASDTVVVSDEVGLGVHPSSDAGRRFRDAVGTLNQAVAEIADSVLLVVAGRVIRLEGGS